MRATVKQAKFKGTSDRAKKAAEQRIYRALDEAIDYLSLNVPVDTGAYANSMYLNQRGDTKGTPQTSRKRDRSQPSDSILNAMEDRLRGSLQSIELLNGATFVNKAPHANFVETYYGVFDQLRNILGR